MCPPSRAHLTIVIIPPACRLRNLMRHAQPTLPHTFALCNAIKQIDGEHVRELGGQPDKVYKRLVREGIKWRSEDLKQRDYTRYSTAIQRADEAKQFKAQAMVGVLAQCCSPGMLGTDILWAACRDARCGQHSYACMR